MRNKRKFIFISLLFLSIGFAAVTTTLVINGTLKLGTNKEDFDRNIIFTRADADTESRASISADGKAITFTSKELKNIYEEATLDFDITNKSRQYGADAAIACTKVDESNPFNDYITLNVEPTEYQLDIGETKSGKLTITMIKSFIGTEESETAEIEIKCTITAGAKEVDISGNEDYVPDTTEKKSLSGYLVDENNNILANKNIVIYANNNTYFTKTDETGFLCSKWNRTRKL